MRDGQVALPPGVFGVGLGETFGYGEVGLVGGDRVGEVALRNQHLADFVMRDGQRSHPPS
jgi:hypothetical protein